MRGDGGRGGGEFSASFPPKTLGDFHSTKNSGNSGWESEWKRHFPEFHFEILGEPPEVGVKFWKIWISGKFCSIRPFLLGPSFSEPGRLILKLLNIIIILVLYRTILQLSNSYNLKTPVCKTSTFQASYFNRIAKLWNYICKFSPPTSFQLLLPFATSLLTTCFNFCSINLIYTIPVPGQLYDLAPLIASF